jgi:hypothetical protein
MRKVTIRMTNLTTESKPATMTINNASATQGAVTTTGFPISVENNGGDETVIFDATSDRQGSIGEAIYSVQNIQNNTVEFSNTMTVREVKFRIGADAQTYRLNDNGTTEGTSQGYHWRFTTQSNGDTYIINVAVSNVDKG